MEVFLLLAGTILKPREDSSLIITALEKCRFKYVSVFLDVLWTTQQLGRSDYDYIFSRKAVTGEKPYLQKKYNCCLDFYHIVNGITAQ
jgi:hypothetical protein